MQRCKICKNKFNIDQEVKVFREMTNACSNRDEKKRKGKYNELGWEWALQINSVEKKREDKRFKLQRAIKTRQDRIRWGKIR